MSASRRTGCCRNCGDAAHPKGNVFQVMSVFDFEWSNRTLHAAPLGCEFVRVCNNCSFPHVFHPRVSAKRRQSNALIEKLIAEVSA